MSVATLLTQPQLVEKLSTMADQDTLAEDFFTLVRRIIANPEKSRHILACFTQGFQQFTTDFISNATNFERGLQQLQTLMVPFINEVKAFGENPALRGNFAGIVAFIAERFLALLDAAARLSVNHIRDFAARLLTILTAQFGFSLNTIVLQLWQLLDMIIIQLRVPPAGTDVEERELSLVTASLLSQLKRALQEHVQVPHLSIDQIATFIMQQLREMGLEQGIQNGRRLADTIKEVFLAAGSIGEVIKTVMGDSVGAAARAPNAGDSYAWYASWLLASRKRDIGQILGNIFILNPSDEVWRTADKTQVVWRTVFDGDITLHEGTNLKWDDAPMFNSTTEEEYLLFPHISTETMEILAQLSWTLVEFGKGVWNSADAAEKGDRATAITHAIWNYFNAGFGALGGKPFISYLLAAAGAGQGHRGWMDGVFPILATVLPSLEGRQTAADKAKFAFWAILLADDVLERAGHHLLLHTGRDLLLSTLTLINNIGQAQGSEASHPINKEYTGTWATIGGTIATIIYLKTLYNKKDYHHPFDGFLWTFASMLAGLVGGMVGTLLGSVWSLGFSPKGFFIDIGIETAKPFFTHYLNLYNFLENDTRDGTYNGDRPVFSGYPEKSDSPYSLPWESGVSRMCVQGNMGMWSHFDASDQIYAVDFGFDQGELIHAARGGTVVGFFDQRVNDDHDHDWNYIVIRHDHAGESMVVRQRHDKYNDGNAFVTYGVYGHGRTNGVREVFAARGIADTAIIGTVVQQGEAVMKAGNTGISFHNHLHFHVKHNGEALGTATPGGPVNPEHLASNTMPFVFRNVAGDGVVRSLNFYTPTDG
jgi:murein DD-endopeptidase MepM/ murein hydrolase activator NlpD